MLCLNGIHLLSGNSALALKRHICSGPISCVEAALPSYGLLDHGLILSLFAFYYYLWSVEHGKQRRHRVHVLLWEFETNKKNKKKC